MTSSLPNALSSFELNHLFFAVVSLLVFAHLFGYVFQRLKMPRVVGEIFGGILLGPSLLGHFFPSVHQWLFNGFTAQGMCMSFIYWLGLVLLMFISGFEVQHHFTRKDTKFVSALVIGTTFVPLFFAIGLLQFMDVSFLLGPKNSLPALYIIIAIAVSVTSIPVISRIFIDLKIMQTQFAKIILSTSTIHDILLWIAFAIAGGMVQIENQSISNIVNTTLITIAFFVLAIFVASPVIKYISHSRFNVIQRASGAGYILIICLVFAAIASILEVNIIFGALLAGMAIGLLPGGILEQEKTMIKQISLAFFISIYFSMVGLKLNLVQDFNLPLLLGFLVFTSFCQLAGTYLSTRFQTITALSWFNIFMAVNTKGGPGIVLATAAFDLGIINAEFFVVLVLAAIITSLFAGVWFRSVISRGLPLLNQ